MRNAIITPFNVFSLLSFILLTGIALLVHQTSLNHVALASASALFGFLLIIMFLVWTLFEGD